MYKYLLFILSTSILLLLSGCTNTKIKPQPKDATNNINSPQIKIKEITNSTAYVCTDTTMKYTRTKQFEDIKAVITVEEFNNVKKEARVTVYDDRSLKKGKIIEDLYFYKNTVSPYGEKMRSFISKHEALIIVDNYKRIAVRVPDKYGFYFESTHCIKIKK